ncbi:MAG: phosphoribosylamine--glycine ligase N-terminal domain-containing protein, partial [Candidatus Cloacimonadota bacterium]|nr:phosphoribosylamine--glycine ligase N-terminal domain-containing protein [Candidatus Cloacimonadota bacterium]
MKILVIGNGGREHAIAHKFSKSDKVDKVFVSPGNPGMLDYAEQIELEGFDEIVEFCQNEDIDIVFVGP